MEHLNTNQKGGKNGWIFDFLEFFPGLRLTQFWILSENSTRPCLSGNVESYIYEVVISHSSPVDNVLIMPMAATYSLETNVLHLEDCWPRSGVSVNQWKRLFVTCKSYYSAQEAT